jgi:ribonuclease HII
MPTETRVVRKKKLIRLKSFPGFAGLDEAGRGPLAGPVYAAAVVLPQGLKIKGLNDSKQLDAKTREALAIEIKSKAIWAVCWAEVEEIDSINILWASMAAMCRALRALPEIPPKALIDGNTYPRDLPCEAETVIGGDGKVACIAAASILAKTERDRKMRELAQQYPDYGFERHFGYSTPEHLAALELYGPCPIHRRSFARCRPDEQLCLTFAE